MTILEYIQIHCTTYGRTVPRHAIKCESHPRSCHPAAVLRSGSCYLDGQEQDSNTAVELVYDRTGPFTAGPDLILRVHTLDLRDGF